MIYQREIEDFQDLPVKQQDRRITDILCAIIGVIFGLTMFIIACIMLNKGNIIKANYPTDNKGNVCILDTDENGQRFPFLYFSDIQDPLKNRHCMKDCPVAGKPPHCGFGQCNIGLYPTHPDANRLGSYCMPDDSTLKQKLMQKSGLYSHWNLLWTIDYLLLGLLVSFVLGLLWMILVQYCPKVMVWVGIVLAILLLITTAIIFFINNGTSLRQASGWAIFFGIVCLLLIFVFLFYLIRHRKRINICIAFIENGTHMLKQNWGVFFYIPVFICLTFLFGILIVFQYLAYSSASGVSNVPENDLYHKLYRPWALTALLIIETIWGLSFLRDAFDYCISGCAVQWYFSKEVRCFEPVKRMLLKNFGSVVGGSFLNGFLYIPGLIVNLFCDEVNFFLCNLFDMTRGDTYAYIYLTGASYCHSCRQCQYLCYRSEICRGNQSTNNIYALAARLVNALASILIVYWISTANLFNGVAPAYLLLGIFFICLFVVGYFIDIHIDVAQALLITFLAEYQIDQTGYSDMRKCRESLKYVIHDIQQTYSKNKTPK